MSDEMLKLAGRCEQASGPDRRLDALIQIALDPDRQTIVGHEPGRFPRNAIYGPVSSFLEWLESADHHDVEGIAGTVRADHYTASLDAAMTLVPEDAFVETTGPLISGGKRLCTAKIDHRHVGMGQSPALALTAAALRSRATIGDGR